MIRVMVAEDNSQLNALYNKAFSQETDIDIVSSSFDGESTIKNYQIFKPDVLLLDLDLPKINGLEIIEKLSNDIEEKKKCNIIIISGSSELYSKLFNASKIYKVYTKPFNLQDVIKTIREISYPSNSELNDESIKSLFLELRVNPFTKGGAYLIDAVNLAYEKPELLYNIKNIYDEIAPKYNLNSEQIQRSVRNSIDIMNKYVSKETLHSFFHIYDYEVVTPKYFISIVTEYFQEKKD